MAWVVDTCVIIDILRGDETFSSPSADALQAKCLDGLLIAPALTIFNPVSARP